MATLKLCIVPAKVLINGKHKVRISLAHNSGTRYIPTNCIIDDLSQFKDGQVINHPEAASMNMKLRNLLNHYQKVIDNIYDVDVYSCSELREIIIKKKNIYFLLQQLISQTVLFIHSSFHLIILVLYNLINHGNTKSSYQFNSKYSGIHEAAHAFFSIYHAHLST